MANSDDVCTDHHKLVLSKHPCQLPQLPAPGSLETLSGYNHGSGEATRARASNYTNTLLVTHPSPIHCSVSNHWSPEVQTLEPQPNNRLRQNLGITAVSICINTIIVD